MMESGESPEPVAATSAFGRPKQAEVRPESVLRRMLADAAGSGSGRAAAEFADGPYRADDHFRHISKGRRTRNPMNNRTCMMVRIRLSRR